MWARVDDGWWCHPKVMGTSLAARGLWVSALSWSARQDTEKVPPAFPAMVGAGQAEVDELLSAGLWVGLDDGWLIVPWDRIVPPKRRRHIPIAVRREVYERDRYQCVTCGAGDDLTLDHIVPYSLRGPDTVENLRVLCRPCNSRRGAPAEGEED